MQNINFLSMLSRYASLFLILLASATGMKLSGQAPLFSKVLNQENIPVTVNSMATYDGHSFILAGESDMEALAIKLDSAGNTVWALKTNQQNFTRFYRCLATPDSAYLLAGLTDYNGQAVMLLLKLGSNGDTLWSKALRAAYGAEARGIIPTSEGGLVVLGNVVDGNPLVSKLALAKLDAAGNLLWDRMVVLGNMQHRAGNVQQAADSGFVIAANVDISTWPYSMGVILKTDKNGAVEWCRKYAPAGNVSNIYLQDILPVDDGFYACGFADGLVIFKAGPDGIPLWGYNYPAWYGFSFYGSPSTDLHMDSDGNLFMVSPSGFLIRTDSAGNVLAAANLAMYPSEIVETPGRGYLTVGNGPVIGVKGEKSEAPCIGLIRTGFGGNGAECVFPGYLDAYGLNIETTPIPYTLQQGLQLYNLPVAVAQVDLIEEYGCVPFIGGFGDDREEGISLMFHPNPGNGIFSLKNNPFIPGKALSVSVCDLYGKRLFSGTVIPGDSLSLDLSFLSSGMYEVRLGQPGKSVTGRVVILR